MTGYLYDYKKLLAETDEVGGEVSNLYTTTTDQEYGDLISEDGENLTHQYDAQACTNALLDNTGTVQATFKYYAYGQLAYSSIDGDAWATLTVDQWATMTVDQWATLPVDIAGAMGAMGQKQYYLDAETQLYLLGTGTNGRYYDPNTARFVSEDPTRQAGSGTNLFAYVDDNPVNRLDPSGHEDGSSDPNDPKHHDDQVKTQQHQDASGLSGGFLGTLITSSGSTTSLARDLTASGDQKSEPSRTAPEQSQFGFNQTQAPAGNLPCHGSRRSPRTDGSKAGRRVGGSRPD